MSEYFVKQSYGSMWHFCHNSQGICFCCMTDEHITQYEILLKNGQSDFDILIDDSDVIHLICQDDAGNIIYIKYENKKWVKYTVMQSKTPSPYKKNFNIQRISNWINIFYTIEHNGRKLLSHQIIDSIKMPNAIDYIEGDFSTAKDDSGNLYAAYVNSSGKLGVKKYIWSRSEWSEFKPVEADGQFKNPYLYINNKIHIICMEDNNIVYISDNSKLTIGSNGMNPIMLQNGSFLYIMWESKKDGKVWASLSSDNGQTFQSPTEFMAGRFASIKIFSLSYTSYEDISARHCYGFISDGTVTLYMLGDFLKIKKSLPKQTSAQIRKEENIELTKLKIQLAQLSEGIAKIGFRLDNLEREVKGLKDSDKKW